MLLTLPVYGIAFGNWGKVQNNNSSLGLHDIREFYSQWGYWLWLGVLVAGQALLLLLPINHRGTPPARASAAENSRPRHRVLSCEPLFRRACFPFFAPFITDHAFELFDASALFRSGTAQNGQHNDSGYATLFTMILTVLVFWVIWALVFFRSFAKSDEPGTLLKRTLKLAPARQHPRTHHRRAEPRHCPPPR